MMVEVRKTLVWATAAAAIVSAALLATSGGVPRVAALADIDEPVSNTGASAPATLATGGLHGPAAATATAR